MKVEKKENSAEFVFEKKLQKLQNEECTLPPPPLPWHRACRSIMGPDVASFPLTCKQGRSNGGNIGDGSSRGPQRFQITSEENAKIGLRSLSDPSSSPRPQIPPSPQTTF